MLPAPAVWDFDWATYKELLDRQYAVFKADFIDTQTEFHKMRLIISSVKELDKEKEFWHVVSRDDHQHGDRPANGDRLIRSHWVKPMIVRHREPEITYFPHQHGNGNTRHFFWHQQENYAVILEEKKNRLYIVTAYLVDEERKAQQFRKYSAAWTNSGGKCNPDACQDN
jgi:hypothetical protein